MFYIIISILIIFLTKLLFKVKLNVSPYFVKYFNIIWIILSLIVFINRSQLVLFNITVEQILLTITLFIITINFGFLLFISKKSDDYKEIEIEHSSYMINNRVFTIILTIIGILLLIIYRESIGMILSGNLLSIREAMYGAEVGGAGSLYNSGFETLFVNWILNNVLLAMNIIIVTIYTKEKKNFGLFLYSLSIMVLSAILTGGRIKLLKLGIIILISLFGINKYSLIRFDSKKLTLMIKKKWDKLIFLILVLGLVTLIITLNRNSATDISVVQTISTYLFSPILYYAKLMDVVVPNMENLYGGAFFGGILRVLYVIMNRVGNFPSLFKYEMIQGVEASTFLEILPGQRYNAFPTMLYHFYRDGGLLWIVIDGLLLTALIAYVYNIFRKKRNLRSESMLLLVTYTFIFGAFRWEGGNYEPWFTSLFIIFFTNPLFRIKEYKNK